MKTTCHQQRIDVGVTSIATVIQEIDITGDMTWYVTL